jgi:hypothetical protein
MGGWVGFEVAMMGQPVWFFSYANRPQSHSHLSSNSVSRSSSRASSYAESASPHPQLHTSLVCGGDLWHGVGVAACFPRLWL